MPSTHALTKITVLAEDDVLRIDLDPANAAVAETERGVTAGALTGGARTDAEKAAGVVLANMFKVPGHVDRYKTNTTPGTTVMTEAVETAIAVSDQVFIDDAAYLIDREVTLRSGVTFNGVDGKLSVFQADGNTYSMFSDGDESKSNITFKDICFDAVSAGVSNRCVLFDADTTNVSTNIRFHRCRFINSYRGAELDKVDGLEFYDCEGEDNDSSLLYVGQNTTTGRSTNVKVRGTKVTNGDIVDASGNGCILISYADGVSVDDTELNATGASAGASNLFHGVYLKDCTSARIDGLRAKDHRRGAAVHIFSSIAGGDAKSEDVIVTNVIATGQTTYAAVRIDQVETLTLSNIKGNKGYTQVCYLTNITGLTAENIQGRNNNEQAIAGTANAMIWAGDILNATWDNIVGIDDETTSGNYGQGAIFHVVGDNTDWDFNNIQMKFPGGGAVGYYAIDLASGTLNRFSVNNVKQNGASKVFNESGTATAGTFTNIVGVSLGTAQWLDFTQLHKFVVNGIHANGSPWVYTSDGTYITARLSANPDTGSDTWVQGDISWRTTPSAGFTPGYVCTTGGSPGTWKEMAVLEA